MEAFKLVTIVHNKNMFRDLIPDIINIQKQTYNINEVKLAYIRFLLLASDYSWMITVVAV